jgi:dTDP-4-amino-4,6-dideoxygalactose transaminase
MSLIPFNRPTITELGHPYISAAFKAERLCGDGAFTQKCQQFLSARLRNATTLLTPSGTAALELAALLLDLKDGDEVIMPSFTFVSTANAFVLRGAKIVFLDVCPDTMNLDASKIEQAITEKTKAIVPVHYAGVACEMDTILEIARHRNIPVVEDAAQAIGANYKTSSLGSLGDLAAFSFHETKNITSGGEGGCLVINNSKYRERAEIIREKGTNRTRFFRGEVDKYTWMDVGSSYLPSDIQAAYLFAQLEKLDEITARRLSIWSRYSQGLSELYDKGLLETPHPPDYAGHNGHIFYIKTRDLAERTSLTEHLKTLGVHAVFHYIPLHSSPAGEKFGEFFGEDRFTTRESERLLRLPLFDSITPEQIAKVIESIIKFFEH